MNTITLTDHNILIKIFTKYLMQLHENLNLLSPMLTADGVSGGVSISGLFAGLSLGLPLAQAVRCL